MAEERNTIYLCLAHMSDEGWEQKYVQEAFDTNWVVPMGPNVNAFEKDLEEFVNGPSKSPLKGDFKPLDRLVVCLSAGTAAVHLALVACGVGPGDEVCVQSFTFCASSHPITYLGAKPVFIGSEADTWNMDPDLLETAIIDRKKKTGHYPKAIIPVALYGMPYRIDRIMEIADKYDIPVIEDAAEGMGSRFNGQVLGTFGKFGVLSFNGNKMITTSGGGALICNGGLSPRPLLQRGSCCAGGNEAVCAGGLKAEKDGGVQLAGRLQTANPVLYEILKENAEKNRNYPTEAEKALWEMLRGSKMGYKFRRQHPIADFIVDFYCPEKCLTIELDGGYHHDSQQAEADKLRTEILEDMGFTEIRFSNDEVLTNMDNVLHIIKTLCRNLPSHRTRLDDKFDQSNSDTNFEQPSPQGAPSLHEQTTCQAAPSLKERAGGEALANTIMWYATQARDAYPYYEHTAIGYNYRMSNVCAGIGRGQMTVLDQHIAHHKHVQALYEELLKDIPGIHLHTAPAAPLSEGEGSGERLFDSNYWLCAATIDPDVHVKGQEDAYKEVVTTAVGGAAGVIKAVDCATTDCQPNDNVEALRVYMLSKKVECRPVWKPMHKQPVYNSLSSVSSPKGTEQPEIIEGPNMAAYTNGIEVDIFKVGFCLPAGPYVTDDDVRYIVTCIKEALTD